jgi:glycosyltransferase involved in cell wall biosynthesis
MLSNSHANDAITIYAQLLSKRIFSNSRCATRASFTLHRRPHVCLGAERIRQVFSLATRFIAVSNSVKERLIHEFNVPDDSRSLVYGFVPFPQLTPAERMARRHRIRNALQWPEDTFVVGGCGGIGWRKGTDLFLTIANAISRDKHCEKMRFLWVGGEQQDREGLHFTYDVHALGLQDRCCRVPVTSEVADYYCAMDAFALTSREDHFPLVMLEAGA